MPDWSTFTSAIAGAFLLLRPRKWPSLTAMLHVQEMQPSRAVEEAG